MRISYPQNGRQRDQAGICRLLVGLDTSNTLLVLETQAEAIWGGYGENVQGLGQKLILRI